MPPKGRKRKSPSAKAKAAKALREKRKKEKKENAQKENAIETEIIDEEEAEANNDHNNITNALEEEKETEEKNVKMYEDSSEEEDNGYKAQQEAIARRIRERRAAGVSRTVLTPEERVQLALSGTSFIKHAKPPTSTSTIDIEKKDLNTYNFDSTRPQKSLSSMGMFGKEEEEKNATKPVGKRIIEFSDSDSDEQNEQAEEDEENEEEEKEEKSFVVPIPRYKFSSNSSSARSLAILSSTLASNPKYADSIKLLRQHERMVRGEEGEEEEEKEKSPKSPPISIPLPKPAVAGAARPSNLQLSTISSFIQKESPSKDASISTTSTQPLTESTILPISSSSSSPSRRVLALYLIHPQMRKKRFKVFSDFTFGSIREKYLQLKGMEGKEIEFRVDGVRVTDEMTPDFLGVEDETQIDVIEIR